MGRIDEEFGEFTPLFKIVIAYQSPQGRYFDRGEVLAYGVVWRYCQLSEGVCRASLDTLGEETGLGRATLQRALKTLQDEGFIREVTPPDAWRGPHLAGPRHWKITDKHARLARVSRRDGVGSHDEMGEGLTTRPKETSTRDKYKREKNPQTPKRSSQGRRVAASQFREAGRNAGELQSAMALDVEEQPPPGRVPAPSTPNGDSPPPRTRTETPEDRRWRILEETGAAPTQAYARRRRED